MRLILILLIAALFMGCTEDVPADVIEKENAETSVSMTPEEAHQIAINNLECQDAGQVTSSVSLNENTGTYWVDILQDDMPECAPACVVHADTGEAEVNWRCTGLNP